MKTKRNRLSNLLTCLGLCAGLLLVSTASDCPVRRSPTDPDVPLVLGATCFDWLVADLVFGDVPDRGTVDVCQADSNSRFADLGDAPVFQVSVDEVLTVARDRSSNRRTYEALTLNRYRLIMVPSDSRLIQDLGYWLDTAELRIWVNSADGLKEALEDLWRTPIQ